MTELKGLNASGFRPLSKGELLAVSGGGDTISDKTIIVVDGIAPDNSDDFAFLIGAIQIGDTPVGGTTVFTPDDGVADVDTSGSTNTTQQAEFDEAELKKIIDGIINGLQELDRKYGEFEIKYPDGKTITSTALLKAFGNVSVLADAGILAANALQGNADAGTVAAFFVGAGITVIGGAAAASPLLVFAGSLVASEVTKLAVNTFVDFADRQLAASAAEAAQSLQNGNGSATPAETFRNFIELFNAFPSFNFDGIVQAPVPPTQSDQIRLGDNSDVGAFDVDFV
ncbi:MAG: hypothetical protein WBA51_11285 [Erythrobacter sp.]